MTWKPYLANRLPFWHGDCLELMKNIPDQSIDMVLCDLPYGTTQNKWDNVIPFDKLWEHYKRIRKDTTPIILTTMQPFTSLIVCSNINEFKYDWIWHKERGTGHLNAKKQPLRDKEDILVFYKKSSLYNPQFGQGQPFGNKAGKIIENGLSDNYGKFGTHREGSDGKRYPKQVLLFKTASNVKRNTIHPTQKPVELFEYLIKTYTHEGMTVLDNCAGSGTTAIACENTNRRWICIEKNFEYYQKAVNRIKEHRRK